MEQVCNNIDESFQIDRPSCRWSPGRVEVSKQGVWLKKGDLPGNNPQATFGNIDLSVLSGRERGSP